MEEAVISKKEFLDSINKDQFMSKCLENFVEIDQKYSRPAENSLREEIEYIREEMEKKKKKLSHIRILTESQKNRFKEMESLSVSEKEKINKELEQQLDRIENRVRQYLQERQKQLTQLEKKESSLIRDTALFQAEISSRIPPLLFNSVVKSMEEFHIQKIKNIKQYLKQCQVGNIRHKCSECGNVLFKRIYPNIVKRDYLEVPYVIGRDHGVYQMFVYNNQDRDVTWQHFQTLCLAQIKLHEKLDYELIVVSEGKERKDQEHFLTKEVSSKEIWKIRVLHPQNFMVVFEEIVENCKKMKQEYLSDSCQNIWDYNMTHLETRLSYKGIAFWDFPYGLTSKEIRLIRNSYNLLECCGVFCLFMVNDNYGDYECEEQDLVYNEMYLLMKELPLVLYNKDVQGYEAYGDRDYVYVLDEYKNL